MSAAAGINYNDRVLIIGQTGAGKSELINHVFTVLRCQRLLFDTKDEWEVRGVTPARSSAEIDWRAPVIHYQPAVDDLADFDRVFKAAMSRGKLSICVHELGDLCEFTSARTPRSVNAYLSKGRAHGRGLIGGSQRPVEMPKRAKTEVQHVFYCGPRLDEEDMRTVAKVAGITSVADLERRVDEHLASHGKYAFWWINRITRELTPCEPLPESLRRRSIVARRTVA